MSYFIYFRNKQGRLCSTIHQLPLTSINIIVGYDDEDCIIETVPCKYINLSTNTKLIKLKQANSQ